jgi:tetratricopeptide (TPR) repeat protein
MLVVGTHVAAALVPAQPSPAATPLLVEPAGAKAGSLATIDRSIAAWTTNVQADPADFLSATTLAVLYHGRGRLTGDLADHDRALALVRHALDGAPTYGPARAAEAAILYTLHDFVGALAAAEALWHDDPAQLGALATMADAKLELGRLDDARADYELLDAAADGPAVDVRLARLAWLSGDPVSALAHARAARAAAVATGAADAPFYAYALGEYARLAGDEELARTSFANALAARPDDSAALVGLARIDAFDGRWDEAVAGLRRAAGIAPQPETLALLGDLLGRAGDRADAAVQYDTVRLTRRLGEQAGVVFDRQLVGFELDHGGADDALLARLVAALAERPDAAGHDLVAWAAYRLGDLALARRESAAARATGIHDARILFHAGAIAVASGDADRGRALLHEALALGPALDPLERLEARRLLD